MKENAEVEITLLNSKGEWLTTHVITEDQVQKLGNVERHIVQPIPRLRDFRTAVHCYLGLYKESSRGEECIHVVRGFFCFVLFCFSFYRISALVCFNHFDDEKNYILKASLKKMIHGALELLQKCKHTYLYTLQKQLQKEKNKYKYTNLWKVNSPNKTDCVS